MLLTCLGGLIFSMSFIASSSSKINGVEMSRGQEHSYPSEELSAEISALSGEAEDSQSILHRPKRMFPEESQEVGSEHRMALEPSTRTTCICPEVLTKGTLVAIIGSLAFLGFFSTLVLLLVAIIILRLMDRQWKKEKKEKKDTDSSKKLPPPVPRRPTDTFYMAPDPYSKYKKASVSSYVDPKDLHPGPRIRQERKYDGKGAETKYPENAYMSMRAAPLLPTDTPENVYTSMAPAFTTSAPGNVYTTTPTAPQFPAPAPEHEYLSIYRPRDEHSDANIGDQLSESMADASLNTGEQSKGQQPALSDFGGPLLNKAEWYGLEYIAYTNLMI